MDNFTFFFFDLKHRTENSATTAQKFFSCFILWIYYKRTNIFVISLPLFPMCVCDYHQTDMMIMMMMIILVQMENALN